MSTHGLRGAVHCGEKGVVAGRQGCCSHAPQQAVERDANAWPTFSSLQHPDLFITGGLYYLFVVGFLTPVNPI